MVGIGTRPEGTSWKQLLIPKEKEKWDLVVEVQIGSLEGRGFPSMQKDNLSYMTYVLSYFLLILASLVFQLKFQLDWRLPGHLAGGVWWDCLSVCLAS